MKNDIHCFSIPVQTNCLLRCEFCPNSDEFQKKQKGSSLENIIEYIKFAEQWNIKEVSLYTEIGEVLLTEPDKLEYILDYCENSDIIEDTYIFTSLTKIIKETLLIAVKEKYSKVSIVVSVYGKNRESMKSRTNRDCFKDFKKNYNLIKDISPDKIYFLDRTTGDKDNVDDIFKSIKLNEDDTSEDFSYNLNKYEKEKNYLPERNGVCTHAVLEECGFNNEGYLVQCGWFVLDMIVGHISEGPDVLKQKLDNILKAQKFNIFNIKCANCGGYEPIC